MKILNLIRHAEAETGLSSKEDFFRSLTDSGIDDIKSLDNYLVHDNFSRHKIICSTSVRTRETLENLKKSLNPDSSVIYSPDLYLGTFKKLLNTVNLESQNTRMITLIGHNPGLSDLISYLVGDYEINDMGTSSFISLSFDKTIKSSSYEGSAKIERFIQSKNNSIIKGKNSLRLRIKDELSGIKSYSGYLNGNWAFFEYEPKSNLIFHNLSDGIIKNGENELIIKFEDGVGNKGLYKSKLYYWLRINKFF